MYILLTGSLAYDYIMDFPDSFKNHILPEQIHILNVCFVVEELKKNFGGVTGNIAYTMKLLGADPLILATLGSDADDYIKALQENNISTENIVISKEKLTSSAHITTDKDDNQITAFYSGAGNEDVNLNLDNITKKIDFAIVGPTKKEAMVNTALQCHNKQIPFVFDPGQQITALTPQEISAMIGQAKFLIANDYETKMIEEKTGWNSYELLDHVEVLITTLGEKGSVIATKDEIFEIQPCKPKSVDDPTGAGDAYRAGFFSAYSKGLDLETCGQVGSVASSYAIENYGTQNHKFTKIEFMKRFFETHKKTIEL